MTNSNNFHAIIKQAIGTKDTLAVLQRTNDDILAFITSGKDDTQVASYNSYERLLYHQISAYYGLHSAPTFRGSTQIIIQRHQKISETERLTRIEEMKALIFNARKAQAAQANASAQASQASDGVAGPSAVPLSSVAAVGPNLGYVGGGPAFVGGGPAAVSPDPLMQHFASLTMGANAGLVAPMPGVNYGSLSSPAFGGFGNLYAPPPLAPHPLAPSMPLVNPFMLAAGGAMPGYLSAPLATKDGMLDRYRAAGGPLAGANFSRSNRNKARKSNPGGSGSGGVTIESALASMDLEVNDALPTAERLPAHPAGPVSFP